MFTDSLLVFDLHVFHCPRMLLKCPWCAYLGACSMPVLCALALSMPTKNREGSPNLPPITHRTFQALQAHQKAASKQPWNDCKPARNPKKAQNASRALFRLKHTGFTAHEDHVLPYIYIYILYIYIYIYMCIFQSTPMTFV